MNRVIFLVDGFNLYHALRADARYSKYKWLDLDKLCRCFVTRAARIERIYYFTALAQWNPDKVKRHQTFIRALLTRGVQPVYGAFRVVDRQCRATCGRWYKTHEEKRTDVNIAIHLFQLAVQDRYDAAAIISGDSDLIPAVEAVKATFPTKRVGIITPPGRAAEELRQVADFHMKIKEHHLQSSLFPVELDLGNGQKIECPQAWR